MADPLTPLRPQGVQTAALVSMERHKSPFRMAVHNRSGASIIIEFAGGAMRVYDNAASVHIRKSR